MDALLAFIADALLGILIDRKPQVERLPVLAPRHAAPARGLPDEAHGGR
jgi:hypothetical protein